MMNQVCIVGNIKGINYSDKEGTLYLEVKRITKNECGEYETDLIEVKTSVDIIKNVDDYCTIGDIVGVRGCLQTDNNKMYVSGNKITFLSSKKRKENEGE